MVQKARRGGEMAQGGGGLIMSMTGGNSHSLNQRLHHLSTNGELLLGDDLKSVADDAIEALKFFRQMQSANEKLKSELHWHQEELRILKAKSEASDRRRKREKPKTAPKPPPAKKSLAKSITDFLCGRVMS